MTIPRASSRIHITLWDKAVGTPGYDKEEWIKLDRYINRLESGRWISVSDSLPEDKQMCIVAVEDSQNAVVARYIGGRQFHDFFKNWVNVTYWRPMPVPPEE